MTKLRHPLLSLAAVGRLAGSLAFTRRRKQNIVEKMPIPDDPRSLAQLSWRHMYQKAVALWHALSPAEKQDWQSAASLRHMTGFAYFISQALRPNPGLYLPLQGGTMQGHIEMDGWHVHGLTAPVHFNDATRKVYVDSQIAASLITPGARVYNSIPIACPHNTAVYLTFDSERYDTDSIHSIPANPSRLTCKTAGKYLIVGQAVFAPNAVARRACAIRINGVTEICEGYAGLDSANRVFLSPVTIYDLAVNDYAEFKVYQDSGGALNITVGGQASPEFMMQRIG